MRAPHPHALIVFIAGVFLFSATGYILATQQNFSSEQACVEEAGSIENAREAFEHGEYYFSEQYYDLKCAYAGYAQAARLDSQVDKWLWYQFGRIDFLRGDFDEAIYKFDRQIEYFGDDPGNVHYMRGLAYAYRAQEEERGGDWRMAEEAFEKYLTLNPISPWARTDLAWVLFAQGRYGEMKPILEIGLEGHSDHPWLLNMYGLALLNTGEREQARTYFVRALSEANKLTAEDWGRSYPGNDPGSWQEGLDEMRSAIEHNLSISG